MIRCEEAFNWVLPDQNSGYPGVPQVLGQTIGGQTIGVAIKQFLQYVSGGGLVMETG